jgi:integration host factor subunit alpha
MTLTKESITHSVFGKLAMSRIASAKAVESTFEIIKKTLESGEDVLLSGFGKFCVKDKGKRRGRNPQSGHDLMLAERRVVTFKCSTVLRTKLNGRRGAHRRSDRTQSSKRKL